MTKGTGGVASRIPNLAGYWAERLQCPECSNAIEASFGDPDGVRCANCKSAFVARNGVLSFGVDDSFYEEHGFTSSGRRFGRSVAGRVGLYFARGHYLHDIGRACPAGSALIELGCGGGSAHLAFTYDVLGVDVSSSSVAAATRVYQSVVQASSTKLPVRRGSADAIVSSYFLEHLDDQMAQGTIAEMNRVLKPKGVAVHCLDVIGDGSFHRWASQQYWYEEVFVGDRGHLGLRSLSDWESIFGNAGFEVKARRAFCRTWLQDLSTWAELDDDAVRGFPRRIGHLASALRTRAGWAPDVLTTLVDDTVGRLLRDSRASKVILTLRKTHELE